MMKKIPFLSLAVFGIAIFMITPAKQWSFNINSEQNHLAYIMGNPNYII